jgi:hypothetical protein
MIRNKITKHAENKTYHYDLTDIQMMKDMDVIDFYRIYFHYWLNNKMLNATTTLNLNLIEFNDFTYEMASSYYWKFKNEIKLDFDYKTNSTLS